MPSSHQWWLQTSRRWVAFEAGWRCTGVGTGSLLQKRCKGYLEFFLVYCFYQRATIQGVCVECALSVRAVPMVRHFGAADDGWDLLSATIVKCLSLSCFGGGCRNFGWRRFVLTLFCPSPRAVCAQYVRSGAEVAGCAVRAHQASPASLGLNQDTSILFPPLAHRFLSVSCVRPMAFCHSKAFQQVGTHCCPKPRGSGLGFFWGGGWGVDSTYHGT